MHSKLTCTSLAVLIGCTTAAESPLTHLQVDMIESGGILWERLALTDGIVYATRTFLGQDGVGVTWGGCCASGALRGCAPVWTL